ncbi:MAG: DUF1810 domain-containing protein [Clostridia bacterium]|nr:DUF1810 domain-containing protein [Clostridia bacterium]
MNDGLERFTQAQDRIWPAVLEEMRAGCKRSHWMWYVFPQLRGLGRSHRAGYYGLCGLEEARAYWAHPVLGARLREVCGIIAGLEGSDPLLLMGYPDNLKLCSCMTLFARVAPEEPLFRRVLEKYYGGQEDAQTLALLVQ